MKQKIINILFSLIVLSGLCFGQDANMDQKQIDEANTMMTELVQKHETLKQYNDKLSDTAYTAGSILFDQEKFQEAEIKFMEALQYNPDNGKARSMYEKCQKINKNDKKEPEIIQSPETEAVHKLMQDPVVREMHDILGRLDLFRHTPEKVITAKVILSNKKYRLIIVDKNFAKNTWLFISKNKAWVSSAVVYKIGKTVSAIQLDRGFPLDQIDASLVVSNMPPINPDDIKKAFIKKLHRKDYHKLIPSLIIILANFGDREPTPTTIFVSELLRKCSGEDFGYRKEADISVKRKALAAWLDWWEQNKSEILQLEKTDESQERTLRIKKLYEHFRRSDSKNIWQQVEKVLSEADFESHKIFANHVCQESEPLARVLGFCILIQASDAKIVEYLKNDLSKGLLPIKEFIQILSTTDNKKFIPVLKILFAHHQEDHEKLLLCTKAIDLGEKEAIGWLIQLLESPDPTIGLSVSKKLRILTMKNFGFSINATDKEKKKTIDKWQKWWKKNQDAFTLPESSLQPNTK